MVSVDILFKEKDVFTCGNIVFEVIHTPGHTKGSCCFIIESERVIFSGDTVFKDTVGRCDLYGGSRDSLVDSIQKLNSLKADYQIFPGHGEETTLNAEKAENLYFQSIQ